MFVYTAILSVASYLALASRFDFEVPGEFFQRWIRAVLWILPLKLALLWIFGQFRSLLTFFSFPDAARLLYALAAAMLLQFGVWFASGGVTMIPRGAIVVDFVLSYAGLAGLRVAMRFFREGMAGGRASTLPGKRIAIIGAGNAGASLARDIQGKPGLGMKVVCFIDDDPQKIGRTLHGLQVLGSRRDLVRILEKIGVSKCLIAMPGASPSVIKETVNLLNKLGMDHDILPPVDVLLSGRASMGHLRHVSPADLLGRETVHIDHDGIEEFIQGEIVLVTGAGGSIGAELCRQIARRLPERLVLIERSEPALFLLDQELGAEFPALPVEPFAVDVCDRAAIGPIFKKFAPSLVFHAAAHKHVPLMERQPVEAVRNNALGTLGIARAALKHGCKKFVLVSTDKAVNPVGVMGASKFLAELLLAELQARPACRTAFCAVRFGNVLDSSGSVVRVFRSQIASGGPVKVTHPEMERYFMSIPEAVGLILQSAQLSTGGEVFALEMGEPLKIRELARQMIELSGFVPGRDIAIEFTGLRPGEKISEESTRGGETKIPTTHPKIHRIVTTDGIPSVIEDLENLGGRLGEISEEQLRIWLRCRAGMAQTATII